MRNGMKNCKEDVETVSVKQIGIMTMHRVRNYGSFLQAYALKRILERSGHSVQYVDIETVPPPAAKKDPASSLRGKLKYLDRYILNRFRFRSVRRQIREMFDRVQSKYLGLEKTFLSAEGCDAVVIGSDEIFNCESGGDFKITAQRFGRIPGVPRVVTYAASCGYTGLDDIAQEDMEAIAQGIESLDAISVRDENTARFVSHFREGEAQRHLDPVLVYDFEEELASVDRTVLPKEPYMVVYAYHNRIHDKEEIRAIRAYAKRHGLKTIAVGGMQAWCDEYAVLTPFEVLACFRNAACVVTDTFHGTVMSAKFNKPFAVIVRSSNANKLEDLLSRLEIRDHKVSRMEELAAILDRPADYTACNQIIEVERGRAEAYLRDVLN